MNNTSQIKSFFEYLPASIKFHKLKNEGMARLIFVLVLFCQLMGSYAQYKIMNSLSSDDMEALFSIIGRTHKLSSILFASCSGISYSYSSRLQE
jgi:hypothetical protein